MTLRTLLQAAPARANELFAKMSETSDGAVKTRERLFAELKAELEQHARLEEEHLFPMLSRNPETRELAAEAKRENKELRASLAELDAMPKGDPAFAERLAALQKAFSQQARDERKELLPAVRRALSDEQMQGVTQRMEAGIAEAEQSRQDEAEERRMRARQEREQAEREARAAEEAVLAEAEAQRERAAGERRLREQARQLADTALRPMAATARAMDDLARQAGAGRRPEVPGMAFTRMLMWPWLNPIEAAVTTRREGVGPEEVIQLGEEVLDIGKRTENRGTARIRRFIVESAVEQEVTLRSERVVVERRRPVQDQVTGEILTELTLEVMETEEVPVIQKRQRLREEIVVRTERSERVEVVRDTLRRDEVAIEQPDARRAGRAARTAR
jgi:stress response protein YsnF/hemerythrin-like domain-containing protein